MGALLLEFLPQGLDPEQRNMSCRSPQRKAVLLFQLLLFNVQALGRSLATLKRVLPASDELTSFPAPVCAYSSRKPRDLGAPVSPAAMMDGVTEKNRRMPGVDVTRVGRRSDCMMGSGGGGDVRGMRGDVDQREMQGSHRDVGLNGIGGENTEH